MNGSDVSSMIHIEMYFLGQNCIYCCLNFDPESHSATESKNVIQTELQICEQKTKSLGIF